MSAYYPIADTIIVEMLRPADSVPQDWLCVMTLTPEEDLTKHIRFIVEYDDGSADAFAVPEATLQQGALEIVRVIAGEWQRDWFLKSGRIVAVRGPKQFAQN